MATSLIAVTALGVASVVGGYILNISYAAPSGQGCRSYMQPAKFEIWEATTNNRASAVKIAEVISPVYTRSGLTDLNTRYVWVNAVDPAGNLGPQHPASNTGGQPVAARAVAPTDIPNGSISTDKLANNAVTREKIGNGAVTSDQLALLAVNEQNIANNAVSVSKIVNQAITEAKLGSGAVTAAKVAAGAISTEKLAAGAVTAYTIATNAITSTKIAAGAVTASAILAGAISAEKIGASQITADKMAANSVSTNALQSDAVRARHIFSGSVEAGKIAANAVSAENLQAGSIVAGKISAGAIDTSSLMVNGVVITEKVAGNAISGGASSALSGVRILSGSAQTVAGPVPASNTGQGGSRNLVIAVADYRTIGNDSAYFGQAEVKLFGNGSQLQVKGFLIDDNFAASVCFIYVHDNPPANVNYEMTASIAGGGGGGCLLDQCKIVSIPFKK